MSALFQLSIKPFSDVNNLVILTGDDSFPEVAVRPPAGYIFSPHYCQFFYADLGTNRERNLGTIVTVKFNKDHDHTLLRITWEGNFRLVSGSG